MTVSSSFGSSAYYEVSVDNVNNRLFVTNGNAAEAINISAPGNPSTLYPISGGTSNALAFNNNNFVFLAGGSQGNVFLSQANSSSASFLAAGPNLSQSVMSLDSQDSIIYVATISNVYILRYSMVNVVTNTKSREQLSNLIMSPNPATDQIIIELTGAQEETLTVFDIYGKICLTENITNKATIDISKLPPGIYNFKAGSSHKLVVISH
jgi:hypothetical protein